MGAREAITKLLTGIRAYHGSPHSFDKFDATKIGTGEGAQAYGHGLYFAGNENVARSYRDALKFKGVDLSSPEALASYWTTQHGGYPAKAIEQLEQARAIKMNLFNPTIDQAIDFLKSGKPNPFIPPKGHMYEVNIKADPAQMLDWDKPLRDQPHVQDFFGYAGKGDKRDVEQAYWRLADRKGPADVSTRLNDAGIPGIKYLDEGSRSNAASRRVVEEAAQLLPNDAAVAKRLQELNALPAPTSNYVVFDPANIDILKKYGVVGAPAGAMGATYDQSQYQP